MIVVDTNLIAYLLLPGGGTENARRVFKTDPMWIAPQRWRSEFLNVLATSLRQELLTLVQANEVMTTAEELMSGGEFRVNATNVLHLAAASSCSGYDCEFVALAQELGVPLITADRALLKKFPDTALAPKKFIG